MNHEPPANNEPSSEHRPQSEFDALPEALGYVETEELRQVHGEFVATHQAGGDTREEAERYHRLGEAVVEAAGPDPAVNARAAIGLIVQQALIAREGGNLELYRYHLGAAWEYAEYMPLEGFAETAATIKVALDATEAEVAPSEAPETVEAEVQEPTAEQLAEACGGVLSPEDCEDLAGMPFDEALGYAFTLLLEQGEDPEELLRSKGILEQEG